MVRMHTLSPTRPTPSGSLAGRTLAGAGLVGAGLAIAIMSIGTPLVSRLVPVAPGGQGQPLAPVLVWVFALFAGAALVFTGTNWLAVTVSAVRSRAARGSSLVRVFGAELPDVVVVSGVVPGEGRPIPDMVVGPFGVVVIGMMGSRDTIRGVGRSWEARTTDGWVPTEHPLDRVARDAERTRHWLTHDDLDFVVRVYAVLVVPDGSIPRSPLCAVATRDQIPAWIASLPRQRSLSAARQGHLVARARGSVGPRSARRDW
jgi:hypothetical protein